MDKSSCIKAAVFLYEMAREAMSANVRCLLRSRQNMIHLCQMMENSDKK